MSRAVKVQGIDCPIIREGDNIVDIVVDSVLKPFKKEFWTDPDNGDDLDTPVVKYINGVNDKDIIGITESLVGRCYGMYVTVQDIADETEKFFGKNAEVLMTNAIYSRNRHSLILRGIARACSKITFLASKEDSRGNLWGVNPYTNVSIPDYYRQICKEENCEFVVLDAEDYKNVELDVHEKVIDCSLHTRKHHSDVKDVYPNYYFLTDYCNDKNPDFGLLGTNKANDENGGTLKLFPSKELAQKVCDEVKAKIFEHCHKDVIVCIYADGCFHSPYQYDENGDIIPGTSINEFADPTTMPAYTDKELMESSPHEIKLKSLIDSNDKKDFSSDEELKSFVNKCKSETSDRKNNESSMGTTPRVYRDLLASLMDLVSGSGDRATPVVLVQNYF